MIALDELNTVAQSAHRDAADFLYIKDSVGFFSQGKPHYTDQHLDYISNIAKLKIFLRAQYEILVPFELDDTPGPCSGYASWLTVSNETPKGAIQLFVKPMIVWHEQTRIPQGVQKIKTILHELGHVCMTPRLLQRTPNAGGPYDLRATEEEEEIAWVYAIAFLGVLVGDYSRQMQSKFLTDDTPRVYL